MLVFSRTQPKPAASACFEQPEGSVTVNRLPLPSSLSTRISPPWSSTRSLVMDKPKPVPSLRNAVRLASGIDVHHHRNTHHLLEADFWPGTTRTDLGE